MAFYVRLVAASGVLGQGSGLNWEPAMNVISRHLEVPGGAGEAVHGGNIRRWFVRGGGEGSWVHSCSRSSISS